ncbi:MAG: aspartate ammonia-lyase [Candidatus Limnocylindria bacterium]
MTAATRRERDPLGEKEVPADAYWGVQTQRGIENFDISGQRPHPLFVRATLFVKRAAAAANRSTGRLDADIADAIMAAADEALDGRPMTDGRPLTDHFRIDPFQAGAGTSHNMNANEVLANRALELLGDERGNYARVSPNDHVNMAQSTNDVIPTAMRIAALDGISALLPALDELILAFDAKAREFDHVVKAGRTHLQDAVPIRLGQEFAAYALTLTRAGGRIKHAADAIREQNIGATAVGTGLNAEPEYIERVVADLSELTGHDLRTADSLVQATQSMAPMLEVSASLRALAVDLLKISEDLRIMSSGPRTGIGEIRLPAVQPGSSIMPGKVNPVMAECLSMVCFHVIGNDTAVAAAAAAGQLELNVMMPMISHDTLESLTLLTNMCRTFARGCVIGIEANVGRATSLVEESSAMATPLAPYLGYALAAEISKEALVTGRTIRQIVLERGIFTQDELDQLLDPWELTSPGVAGGLRFSPRL